MVLSGPLVFVVPWLLFCVWVGAKAVKRFTSGSAKLAVAVLAVGIFMAPVADEIAGRIYFNHLCSTEAGVKVYRTVELPAEYWDEQGTPKFRVYEKLMSNHETMFTMDGKTWEDERFAHSGFTEPYSSAFHIEKSGYRLRERESGNVLGEVWNFMYWGGWISRNFSLHSTANSCEMKKLDDWQFSIFKPAVLTR